MLWRRVVTLVAATGVTALGFAGVASAGTFTVTTANDSNSGTCTAQACSLRQAVEAADATGGAGTIMLPAGTYTLSIPSSAVNDPVTGDLDIQSGTSIAVNGAGAVIDAAHIDRAFAVQHGATLTLSGVTIENGSPSTNSTGSQNGGAIYDNGTLSVTNSTFLHNFAGAGGGAVFVAGAGSATLVDATISDNTAARGGGLDLQAPATLTNDTIAFNRPQGVFGTSAAGSAVKNTLVADNVVADCANPAGSSQFPAGADAGNNLDSDRSCFHGGASSDKTGVDPLLAPNADNGGPVQTDALAPASPAIDGGAVSGCPATDARGLSRPQGAACDIGAYEFEASTLSLRNSAPAKAGTGIPFTYTITASNRGPGPSTATTVTDQLPAGSTLYESSASQGTCTSTGAPAHVTCALGTVASGASATVSLVVAFAHPGSVTDSATASNGEGSTPSASARTTVQALVAPVGATAPGAVTGTASQISSEAVLLSGSVDPGGQPTAYFFELGPTTSYGGATPLGQIGGSSTTVAAATGRLKPATRYHYRLVAINDSGIAYGADRTFRLTTGRVQVSGSRLAVRGGQALVPFTCASALACRGTFSITGHLGGSAHQVLTCTVSRFSLSAHGRKTVRAPLRQACVAALRSHRGKLGASLTAAPATPQAGVVTKSITLALA